MNIFYKNFCDRLMRCNAMNTIDPHTPRMGAWKNTFLMGIIIICIGELFYTVELHGVMQLTVYPYTYGLEFAGHDDFPTHVTKPRHN